MSIVRKNLMNEKGYTPYCGEINCDVMPRTYFNGSQFQCPKCGWKSNFQTVFITEYKFKWSKK